MKRLSSIIFSHTFGKKFLYLCSSGERDVADTTKLQRYVTYID